MVGDRPEELARNSKQVLSQLEGCRKLLRSKEDQCGLGRLLLLLLRFLM